MARERAVTRTVRETVLSVLCLDTETETPFTKEVKIPGIFTSEKKLWKKIEKELNTSNVRAVKVVSSREQETLYGMTEEDFVKAAKVLPPRNTKQIEKEISA